MKKVFDEEFYTDDFDKEIIDYLVDAEWIVKDNDGDSANLSDKYLRFGTTSYYFWTTNNPCNFNLGTLLTKQQFKEKIGMTNKQFTKADLQDGMRVVYRSGYLRIVFAEGLYELLAGDLVHQLDLTEYRDDLTVYGSSNSWDIMKVTDRDGTVLFTRQEKSPAQIELDKLQEQMVSLHEQIASLQQQADKLQQTL